MNAIGIVELISIARGYAAADAMLKAASVELHAAKPVCPGKFAVLVYGSVAEVQSSVAAGVDAGGQFVVDQLVIANIHPSVWPTIMGVAAPPSIESLGVVETYSIASTVLAADAAVKAAAVDLVEVRLALGLGGKAFSMVTGEVGAVQAAVEAARAAASARGLLTESVVIPAPARGLLEFPI
ncbi:MAG: BMC domain-containing protein [Clostridia bacterium]|nr:BMC domain-containing protein [Clostridia bacterium]